MRADWQNSSTVIAKLVWLQAVSASARVCFIPHTVAFIRNEHHM